MLTAIGAMALLAWVYLLFFHHGFWRSDQRLANDESLTDWPSVTAIIPARNEAASIEACVSTLAAQGYPGAFRIVVVDDSSTDATAALAQQVASASAQIDVLSAPPLEPGWTGKLWALSHGIEAAPAADMLWFTDADIVHEPGVLQQLVTKAQEDDRDLVSLMVKLHCKSFWEHLLVPAFIFFFQMLYPFPAVNNPRSKVAGAAGGCVLIRRTALDRIGGIAAIKDALIDDCALAEAVKKGGGNIWLGLADYSRSIRPADGLSSLWHMVTRTAFTQLGYSVVLLLGTVAALTLIFLMPPLLLLSLPWHDDIVAGLMGGTAWLAMAIAYRPTLLVYGRPALAGLLLPVIAALYTAMTIHSAINHWFGASSHWKGRDYRL